MYLAFIIQSPMPLSVRISKRTEQRLAALAVSTARTKSYLAARALETYLNEQEWQIKAIEEGLKDAEEGRLIPHEEVMQWLESWGTENELPRPQCKR